MKRNQKIALLGITVSIAIVLSYIEAIIPSFVPIPGVKIGLANIVIMFILYKLDLLSASIVSAVRLATVFLIFGGLVPLLYSIAGAVLSLSVMYVFKRFTPFSEIGVSVAGGVSHNIAQIIVAIFMFNTGSLIYYLPVLLLSGTLSGVLIGIISGTLIKKIKFIKEK